jgi:chemotaxis protein MotB
MRKLIVFSAILAALVMLAVSGCASHKAELIMLRGQVDTLQAKVNQLQAEKAAAQQRVAELQSELDSLARKEKMYVEKLDSYTVLRVQDELLFRSGSHRITTDGERRLDDIANVLERYPDFTIRVEGHTDNKQIMPEYRDKYPSNWELSTRRATSVVHYLVDKDGMDPAQLTAVGLGEYHPIADNGTVEGRQQNRRVEFFIAPKHPVKDISDQPQQTKEETQPLP